MSESTKDNKQKLHKYGYEQRSSDERDRDRGDKREGKSSSNSRRHRDEGKTKYGSELKRTNERLDREHKVDEIDREYDKKRRIKKEEEKDKRWEDVNKMEQKPCWKNKRVQKHAEMIQERKLLWKGNRNKNNEKEDEMGKQGTSQMGKNEIGVNNEKKLENKWTSMIAATAKDTQQMDKFQRLMGLKKKTSQEEMEKAESEGNKGDDPLALTKDELAREYNRQMEMQRELDKQFEMARHTHHSARGRGLGSF